MNKPIIEIYIPCIVVPAKTGIIYTNQVGGYACHHFEVEGYIIPLDPNFYVRLKEGEKSNCNNPYWMKYNLQEYFDKLFAPLKEEDTKYNGHGYVGIDSKDVEYIEQAFKETFLEIEIDRTRLSECEEAKIFVNIKFKQYNNEGKEIEPLCVEGILTWENSD